MSTGNPPAGYYADPSVPGYIRYWDGTQWVAGTSRPAPEEVADQVLASSQPGAAASSGGAHARPAAEPAQPAGTWQPQQAEEPRDAVSPAAGPGRSAPRQYLHNPQQAQAQAQAPAQQQLQAQQQQQQAQQLQAQQQQLQAQQQQAQQQQLLAQQQLQQLTRPQVQSQPRVPAQPQQPTAQPVSVAPQIAESVSTMVVPSAFGGRGNTNHYGFANPFAGLPGSPTAQQRPDEESEVETKVVELATPGSRILARIIDLGIAAVFSAPITVSLLLVAHRHDHQYVLHLDAQATTTYTTLGMDGLGIGLWVGALLTLILVSILVEGYRLGRGGQTFGKRMAGIRVVQLSDGAPLARRGAGTRRSLLFWVFAILPLIDVFTLGGVLWGRPYRQGAHERLTSTVTVKA